jgi:hypothetical protein
MIRLPNQGAAEELHLRLLDDNTDFVSLARSHSLGEKRFTRGFVGPMLISQSIPRSEPPWQVQGRLSAFVLPCGCLGAVDAHLCFCGNVICRSCINPQAQVCAPVHLRLSMVGVPTQGFEL